MKLLDRLRQDVKGLEVLRDWLGDSAMPVERDQAEARARVCTHGNAGKACPWNEQAAWWDLHEMAKDKIAQAIRYQLELKARCSMQLPNEGELGTCNACGCNLRLKVWTPILYLKDHLTPEQLLRYPLYCWQKTEVERL
jgi:hypothetical protein